MAKKAYAAMAEAISPGEHCPDCLTDKTVFCPRDTDAQCLICRKRFCGAHIGPHLEKVHCVALDNDHCSEEDARTKRARRAFARWLRKNGTRDGDRPDVRIVYFQEPDFDAFLKEMEG